MVAEHSLLLLQGQPAVCQKTSKTASLLTFPSLSLHDGCTYAQLHLILRSLTVRALDAKQHHQR